MAKPSDRLVLPVETSFSMEIENENIPRKNLVRQVSRAMKLCKMDKLLIFVIEKQLLALLPLFVKKRFSAF